MKTSEMTKKNLKQKKNKNNKKLKYSILISNTDNIFFQMYAIWRHNTSASRKSDNINIGEELDNANELLPRLRT